ncbi:hypothetical protein BXU11_04275 [Flavobacterium sp. LM5]|uniref:hypothetical protein n=1 Tax=Flavobacterium sp. LM5 TaxID=1938610 RepID=UPI000993BA7E|nr:hypothetical protein [Flavobacterium sp. LM5]OOV29147.1 hypothetical protein BXU11_04275 [Flavobacterium sp. LM5]
MDNSSIQKEQNEYAKNVKGEPIYILEAESGRKGYWCMGCDAEMEAVIQKKHTLYKSYFRHIAKDVKKGEIPCTFSNQDYRHNLAIDILQRTKRVKVPNLYKYALDGKSAKLIQEATFVEAHSVKKELSFYEDDDGEVKFGKNPEIDTKNLLIRPDVTFFDIHGKPILLIKIVVSHKLNEEKKAKIRRLGIDTIQIIIPKDSPENIAKNFLVTKSTKWVFNHVEQNTNFFQLPTEHSEGISQIDELQMGFFGESIICRKNQISNLIRSITRCVESQFYKRVEFNIGQEISRIEASTRKHQSRLDEIQAGIEREIHSENLNQEEKNLNQEEESLKKTILTWKNDILSADKKLQMNKLILTGRLSLDTELENLKMTLEENLNQKKQELTVSSAELSENKGILSMKSNQNQDSKRILMEKNYELKMKKETLNKNLQTLKDKNVKDLKALEKSFNLMKEQMENSQNSQLRREYEANLKGNTNKLLKELTIEMYSQMTNCPKELKLYLNYGEYLMIITMYKQLSKDAEQEKKLLKSDLIKNGINEEWFMNNLS